MPPQGVICEVTKERLSASDCLSCGKSGHPRGTCTLEPAMIRKMWEESDDDLGVRVTRLCGCLRGAALEARESFYYTTNQLWAFFRGRLAHKVVEEGHADDDRSVAEVRFFTEINGIKLSGQPDLLYPYRTPPKVVDFKSTGTMPEHPHHGHIAQTNFYRLLVLSEYPQYREEVILEILYFTMNARRRLSAPLWSTEQTRSEIEKRLDVYLEGTRPGGWLPDVLPIAEQILCGYCAVADCCIDAIGPRKSLRRARGLRPGSRMKLLDQAVVINALFEDGANRRWCLVERDERPYLLDMLSPFYGR